MKQSKLEKLGIIGLPLKLGSHTYYIGLDPEDGDNKQSKLKVTAAPSRVVWDTVKFKDFLEKDCKFINLEMIKERLSKLKSSRKFVPDILERVCLFVWKTIAEFWTSIYDTMAQQESWKDYLAEIREKSQNFSVNVVRPANLIGLANAEQEILTNIGPAQFGNQIMLNQVMNTFKTKSASLISTILAKSKDAASKGFSTNRSKVEQTEKDKQFGRDLVQEKIKSKESEILGDHSLSALEKVTKIQDMKSKELKFGGIVNSDLEKLAKNLYSSYIESMNKYLDNYVRKTGGRAPNENETENFSKKLAKNRVARLKKIDDGSAYYLGALGFFSDLADQNAYKNGLSYFLSEERGRHAQFLKSVSTSDHDKSGESKRLKLANRLKSLYGSGKVLNKSN